MYSHFQWINTSCTWYCTKSQEENESHIYMKYLNINANSTEITLFYFSSMLPEIA